MLQKFEFYSLFVIIFTVGVVFCATSDVKEESDRGAHSDRGGLWFGPRLGKRSLKLPNEDNRDIFFKLLEAADALKYYYDQVPESYLERRNDPDTRVAKKVIFTPKLGRSLGEDQERQFVDFTPRLGRRLAEELSINTPTDQEIYSSDGDRIGARTRYFSPRLGRTMSFSPRLGRELSYGR